MINIISTFPALKRGEKIGKEYFSLPFNLFYLYVLFKNLLYFLVFYKGNNLSKRKGNKNEYILVIEIGTTLRGFVITKSAPIKKLNYQTHRQPTTNFLRVFSFKVKNIKKYFQ